MCLPQGVPESGIYQVRLFYIFGSKRNYIAGYRGTLNGQTLFDCEFGGAGGHNTCPGYVSGYSDGYRTYGYFSIVTSVYLNKNQSSIDMYVSALEMARHDDVYVKGERAVLM
jgi:hypothetical protein